VKKGEKRAKCHMVHYPEGLVWLMDKVEELADRQSKTVSEFIREAILTTWKERDAEIKKKLAMYQELHGDRS
jgi:hypothetical protein